MLTTKTVICPLNLCNTKAHGHYYWHYSPDTPRRPEGTSKGPYCNYHYQYLNYDY